MSNENEGGLGLPEEELDIPMEPLKKSEDETRSLDAAQATAEPAPAPTAELPQESLEEPSVDAFAAIADNAESMALESLQSEDLVWEDLVTPNPAVTMTSPQVAPHSKKVPYWLAAMKLGREEVEKIRAQFNVREEDLTEKRVKELSPVEARLVTMMRALENIFQDGYYQDVFRTGDWAQSVRHNDTELGTRKVKMERVSDPVLQIRSAIGQGTLVQIPLWNTGIWVTLRAPANNELLELDQRIRMEKQTLGRYSNGMVFSNTEVYTVDHLARFALDHVYAATYEFETNDTTQELLELVKSTDFPQLMYGMLCAMYPDGYPFRQPCVAKPNECDHVDELILSMPRLSWTDRSRLTAKQKRMMASRTAKMTRAQIDEYQAEFPHDNRAIELKRGVKAIMGVPSLREQIDSGYRWVDGITEATNKAFGMKLSEVDRYRYVQQQGLMSSLRQYGHWITRFEYSAQDGVDPTVIDDPIKKDETLEALSGDEAILKLLDDSILKWIDNCSVTVIGLAKSTCPKCQQQPSEEVTKHPHLIPLDVGYIFFTLVALKLKQIIGVDE